MGQQIRTRWHQVLSLFEKDEVYITAPKDGLAEHWDDLEPDKVVFKAMCEELSVTPRFVIADDLMDLASGNDHHKSLIDMKRAGVMRLPFPTIVVEFQTHGGRRCICMLRDIAQISTSEKKRMDPLIFDSFENGFYGITMFLDRDDNGEYLVLCPGVLFIDLREKSAIETGPEFQLAIGADCSNLFAKRKEANKIVGKTYVKDGSWIWKALSASMLLMHTDGVAKEIIDCEKVNRKRRQNHKPLIPKHTYLHIGRVYKHNDSDESTEYIPRVSPRPHWRRGHIKTYWHGPHRTLKKMKYIHPKIVALKSWTDEELSAGKEYHVSK